MAQQETRDRLLNKHYWQKMKIKKPVLLQLANPNQNELILAGIIDNQT